MAAAPTSLGETLFRVAVRATLSALLPGAGDIAEALAPTTLGKLLEGASEELRNLFTESAWGWLVKRKIPEQDRALAELSRIPYREAGVIAQSELANRGASPDVARMLRSTFAAVPMSAARALDVIHEAGNTSAATCLTRTPDPKVRLAMLFPLFPPMFEPEQRLEHTDYLLDALLGQGAMGEVWQAYNPHLTSKPAVAMKFLRDPDKLPSLRREAEVLNRLGKDYSKHGIIELMDTNFAVSRPYLVYECLEGGTLKDWIALYPGPVPVKKLLLVMRQLARALAHAHERNVVHRDVKPANVLVGTDGEVKLADWSIASLGETVHDSAPLQSGHTIAQASSTPMYADPLIRVGSPVTPAYDIYAFGVLAYQGLAGDVSLPMVPAWRQVLASHVQAQVPEALLAVIDACVAHDPSRIQNGRDLLSALEAVRSDSLQAASPAPGLADSQPTSRPQAASPPVPTATVICGTVSSGATGRPIAGAELTFCLDGNPIGKLSSDSAGFFAFNEVSGALMGRELECTAAHGGFTPVTAQRTIDASEVIWNIPLDPAEGSPA